MKLNTQQGNMIAQVSGLIAMLVLISTGAYTAYRSNMDRKQTSHMAAIKWVEYAEQNCISTDTIYGASMKIGKQYYEFNGTGWQCKNGEKHWVKHEVSACAKDVAACINVDPEDIPNLAKS